MSRSPRTLTDGSATPSALMRWAIESEVRCRTECDVPDGASRTTEIPPTRSRPSWGRVPVMNPAIAPATSAPITAIESASLVVVFIEGAPVLCCEASVRRTNAPNSRRLAGPLVRWAFVLVGLGFDGLAKDRGFQHADLRTGRDLHGDRLVVDGPNRAEHAPDRHHVVPDTELADELTLRARPPLLRPDQQEVEDGDHQDER